MAQYPETNLQSQLISAGLNPSNPTQTYVEFAEKMARNRQEQAQMESNLARAKELLSQEKIRSRQESQAESAGYNPQLAEMMSKDQAKAYLETLIEAKKIKVEADTIDKWFNTLPELVHRREVESFMGSLARPDGLTGSFNYTKDTATVGGKVYNVAVRRRDGKRTDKFDPETGEPVFADMADEATTPEEKAEVKTILARAVRQEAGSQARLGFQEFKNTELSWQKLQDKINTSNAPAARAIGQAAVNNMRADRALELLNKDGGLTKGEYDIVSSDLAAIFKGGVPDVLSLEHQRYETLKGKFAGLQQYITSNPAEINTPAIKDRLRDVTTDVKSIDNGIILNYMDSVAAGYEPFIQADPARFARMVNAQLRNMNKPTIDVSVIENLKETPIQEAVSKPEKKAEKSDDAGIHELAKVLKIPLKKKEGSK